ncbi:hypothetical protein HAZ28_004388 [Salmonella enterica]|nr:hypothetical protein [Salmonella enterica]
MARQLGLEYSILLSPSSLSEGAMDEKSGGKVYAMAAKLTPAPRFFMLSLFTAHCSVERKLTSGEKARLKNRLMDSDVCEMPFTDLKYTVSGAFFTIHNV